MSFKALLFLLLLAYWAALVAVLYLFDVSRFIDSESVVYVLILSVGTVFFTSSSSRAVLPFSVIISNYVFWKYLLGTLKLGLLSDYGKETWMFGSYAWATVNEVNVWLRHGTLSTLFLTAGIYCIDRIKGRRAIQRLTAIDHLPMKISFGYLLPVLSFFLFYSMFLFTKSGYGAISGVQDDAMTNLYGVINSQPAVLISLVVLISQWHSLRKPHRIMFVSLLAIFTVFGIFAGARSFIFFTLIYFLILASHFKGNFMIGKKVFLAIAVLCLLNILLYPVALGFKQAIKYSMTPGERLDLSFVSRNAPAIQTTAENFFNGNSGVLEIIDRLSDLDTPLRIINDTGVISPDKHMTFLKVVKRTINNMFPGDVFSDEVSAQQLAQNIYFGEDAVYGGAEWGLYGIYYLLFGYIGSLVASFATGLTVCLLWLNLALRRFTYRPVLVAYFLNSFYIYMHNPLLEMWFVMTIFRPILTLLIIYVSMATVSSFAKSIPTIPRRALRPHVHDLK